MSDGPREELQRYLKAGVESTTDILGWWGVSQLSFGNPPNSDETRVTPSIRH